MSNNTTIIDPSIAGFGNKIDCAKALHVYATLNRGGAETWLMDIMRIADRSRVAIDICLLGNAIGPYEEEFQQLGGKIHRCPLGGNALKFYRDFKQLLTQHEYDVVHSHVYYFSGVVLRAAHAAGVAQRVAHIHPIEDFNSGKRLRRIYTTWMRNWIVKFGTQFVAPTTDGLEAFWGTAWREDGNKAPIYNGINVERFAVDSDRQELRRELDIPENARIALNVSRFAPHKRHMYLVDVAEHVIPKTDDVYFVLVGAGDLRDETMHAVKQRGLESRFRFVAGAPTIDKFWLGADAFAFPSCNEGFGIVVAEAAAAGLPVVAQDIPGVRDAAKSCHDIQLLSLDTPPQQWADSLLQALEKGPLSAADRLERLADFPFTIQKSAESLEKLYGIR